MYLEVEETCLPPTLDNHPINNLVTWVYEEGSYVPVAKIQNGERYTIISDYDIYGNLRNRKGIRDFIPFRQLGQYEDDESGLYYNRFRYYDPRTGNYISQDPIRLAYGYVVDSNTQDELFGLECGTLKDAQKKIKKDKEQMKLVELMLPYQMCRILNGMHMVRVNGMVL